uniref:Pentatricopeptide repeat-containing protein n=1 Tax=Ananas comosus var. bracteatus TaxID=296719 RepID=A0A6V7PKF0_ANACO|nr:unnamed protein product [Ananas comosus var. bracteatus]
MEPIKTLDAAPRCPSHQIASSSSFDDDDAPASSSLFIPETLVLLFFFFLFGGGGGGGGGSLGGTDHSGEAPTLAKLGFEPPFPTDFAPNHGGLVEEDPREVRRILRQITDEEGSGSAPYICQMLLYKFREWDSNTIVWDMLANAYATSKMIHDALYVLSKMDSLTMQASISTYDSLLYSVRRTDIAWELFQEAKLMVLQEKGKSSRPCIMTFNALMSALCNVGFVQVAKSFIPIMLKYGLLPDRYSYSTLIHGLCIVGSMEEALELSEEMQKSGMEFDMITFNSLINGYRLLGLMSEVWKLIQMMIQQGLQPDLVTYTILITGLCEKGNVEEGLRMRMEILSRGFELNIVTYSVLLNALCKRGLVHEVEKLLNEIETIVWIWT